MTPEEILRRFLDDPGACSSLNARAALDALVAERDTERERADRAERRLRDAPLGGDGSHWEGCWRSHIDCAVARVEAAEARADTLAKALREILEDEWATDAEGIEFGDLERMIGSHVSVARAALAAADTGTPPQEACDGSGECKAQRHTHGCYSDDGTNCDHPSEHGTPPQEGAARETWWRVRFTIDYLDFSDEAEAEELAERMVRMVHATHPWAQAFSGPFALVDQMKEDSA